MLWVDYRINGKNDITKKRKQLSQETKVVIKKNVN